MANTYTKCHVHLVFAVKNRDALISRHWKDDLEKYITGIVEKNDHKLLAIGSMPDHIHIFIGYNVTKSIPELVENIKTSSNAWIRQKRLCKTRFEWQKGYGAFTHSYSHVKRVINYVLTQEEHHRKESFKSEYLDFLEKHLVSYNEKYLFTFFERSYESEEGHDQLQ